MLFASAQLIQNVGMHQFESVITANMFSILSLLTALLPLALAASTPCNNSPSLCNRSYSNVTQLGAHDSAFVRDASTGYSISGDQYYSSTAQLSSGVRMLTAQVHANATDGLHLCHTNCSLLDVGRFSDWLSGIKTWLDDNPTDVVTILIVNDGYSTATIAAEYERAGITSYTYTPATPTQPFEWPTLQSMITANTRLVSFVDAPVDSGAAAPYLLAEFDHMFENSYNNLAPTDFSCTPTRPTSIAGNAAAAAQASLFPLMNHVLYTNLADSGPLAGIHISNPGASPMTNAPLGSANCTMEGGCLGLIAQECASQYGRAPVFVVCDWVNVGPAIEAVDQLNGVTDAVGRTALSSAAAVVSSSASASASATSSVATSSGASATSGTGGAAASTTQASIGAKESTARSWLMSAIAAMLCVAYLV
jgi:hypothetical protein